MHSADLELLLSNPPFSEFPALLPQLTPIISSHISVQARGLARVLFPSTNPSFIHRAIPQILPTTQTLLSNLSSSREALTSSRLAATSNLVVHLNQQAEALSLLLQALEAKNGPAALSSTLRAWKGSLEAQTWAAALNLLLSETRVHVYPLEAQAALENYSRHLRDAQMQLSNKLRTRELELGEYGLSIGPEGGGSGTRRANNEREQKFRELARVWNEMEKRMKEVNGELKRLDRN